MMLVLVTLVQAEGQVVTREELILQCWENRVVSDDAINRVISRLRALSFTIGASCFELETLTKVGYRLLSASPSVISQESPSTIASADLPPGTLSHISRRRLLLGIGSSAAALALGGGYLALHWTALERGSGSSVLIMLVLPFDALSNDSVAPLFARSVTEALRADLGRVSGVQFIAAVSSQAIAHQQLSAKEILLRTGANLLVAGSVAIEGGTARVSLTLTDTHADKQLWSTSVTGPTENLLVLQEETSARLIQQIASQIHSSEPIVTGPTYHRDPAVYRLTLQAEQLLDNVRTLRMSDQLGTAFNSADQADKLVQQALKTDKNDPESLLIQAQLVRNGWTRALAAQPLTTMQRASASLEYIRRALYADAANPAALVSLGDYYRRFEWRWNEAEALFKRALAINPSLIEAHWSYAYELGTLGNALAGLDHALTLYRLHGTASHCPGCST